jgi:hypothetical protein
MHHKYKVVRLEIRYEKKEKVNTHRQRNLKQLL